MKSYLFFLQHKARLMAMQITSSNKETAEEYRALMRHERHEPEAKANQQKTEMHKQSQIVCLNTCCYKSCWTREFLFHVFLAFSHKKTKTKTKNQTKTKKAPLIFNPTAPQVSGPPASGGTERKQPSGTLPFRSAVKEGETRGNGPFITGRQGGDCSSWQWLPNKAWDHRTPLIWLPLRGPWSSARVPPGPTGRLSSPKDTSACTTPTHNASIQKMIKKK